MIIDFGHGENINAKRSDTAAIAAQHFGVTEVIVKERSKLKLNMGADKGNQHLDSALTV
jgi:hypothetical protein